MISYKRIGCSEQIDVNKTGTECMICRYYYFKDGFKYQPYVCNACHDFSMAAQNFGNFFILTIKDIDCRVYIVGINPLFHNVEKWPNIL